ncbi:MAG: TetR/AcrR family transcriptional regulator [Mycobacterium sp.]
MARQVKPDEHAARRREIFDAALQLIHDKGYERMTIEDLLSRLQISKGALYHYFDSKRALLDGIVAAMSESASGPLRAVVADSSLGAIDKLNAYFAAAGAWKAENPTAVAASIRLWRDENALIRQKVSQESMRTAVPLLEAIIHQGRDEGVFDTDFPHEAAMFVAGMDAILADAFQDAIEADGRSGTDVSGPRSRRVVAAYFQALERILGAPTGSLTSTVARGRA